MKISRMANVIEPSLTRKLFNIAKQYDNVIDLTLGDPDVQPNEQIKKAACKAIMDGKTRYSANAGLPELRKAIAGCIEKEYKTPIDFDKNIIVTVGGMEALFLTFATILDPGDVMLVPDPCYPIFADGPRIAGAELYYMPQKKEKEYVIQLNEIPEEVAKKAKFMLVSYPNNPTAAMAPESFYHELVAFAKKYDIIVLHDNAYSELVFDGQTWGSFLSIPGAKDVGVEFNSLSKTYGMAGARIGFCLGNAKVVGMLKTLKSNMDYGMFLPVQKGAVAALTGDQSIVADTCKAYERRRDVLCDGLIKAGWHMDKPAGTMFVWAPIPDSYSDSESFVKDLLDKTGVLVTPGSAFGPSGEGFVRMALVQSEEDMAKIVAAVAKSGIFAK